MFFSTESAGHNYSQWDQSQIGVKLGSEHVVYQTLANFM